MSATTYSERRFGGRASPRRRALSLALAIAFEALLLLAFFAIDWREKELPEFAGGRLTTFDVAAPSEQVQQTRTEQQDEVARQEVTIPPRPVSPIPKPRIELPPTKLQMIEVSRAEYLGSDIAKLGSNAPGYVKVASGGSGSAADSQQVGNAPNGQPLYAAEWYREPTSTELGAYLPKSMPEGGGWGMVACKTAERYRVTDCVELGNSPPGSRLAGAVRQAAWQFLVRPPRIGGKAMIGEWVRIRITYSPSNKPG